MSRMLLFTGEKRVGKSTAVKRVVEAIGRTRFAGFLAHEVRMDGRRVGFEIAMLDGRSGVLASEDSDSPIRIGSDNVEGRPRYGIELNFLEDVAIPVLLEDANAGVKRILVIDEIGPMQLHSASFRSALIQLAESSAIVLGTIVLRDIPWVNDFKARPDVETFLLTPQNRATMSSMMELYLSQLLALNHRDMVMQ